MSYSSEEKNTSSLISWLGLGISIIVLAIVLFADFIEYASSDSPEALPPLYLILILVAGLLGLLGLVFSVVGLVRAIKNHAPKWMGTCGIIVSFISLICYFAMPFFAGDRLVKEPTKVEIPSSLKQAVIHITEDGIVSCSSTEAAELQFNLKEADAKAKLNLWLKENVTDDELLILNASSILPYSDINQLMDMLNECGYNRFELHSEDKH